MLKNIGIAALLISGLYTDVQLWACKQAVAQKSDQVLPDGIHPSAHAHIPAVLGARQSRSRLGP